MAKTTAGTAHRHKDSRGKWVTEELPHTHDYTEQFTPEEVVKVKLLIIAGGGGGTTPIPNPPPSPPPDITAPTVSGVSASVTTTTATVIATTDEASTVIVEYGTSTAYGSQTAATASGTSHSRTLTGLIPGQAYQYRIRATDTAGNLRLDQNRTFTTTAVATLPGAPTGLTATGANTAISLSWTAPANNGGSAITGYRIFRNGASLTTVGVVLTYNNTGLTNGTTYTYTVAAITAVGEGPQSNTAFATPAAAGDVNPPIISNVAISSVTTTGATVSWSLNEGGTGQVEYGTTIGYGSTTTLEASYLTVHSQPLTGLLPGQTYHVRVRSADAAGNLAVSPDRTFTTTQTTPTPSPTRPFAAPVTTNTVNVAAGANLQSIVNAAPDGTKFLINGLVSTPLVLTDRDHLVFEGTGTLGTCGIKLASGAACVKLDKRNNNIAFNNLLLQGVNTNPTNFISANEGHHGVAVFESNQIEVGNCRILNTGGDGVMVAGKNIAPTGPSVDVWIHDTTIDMIGRMGAALIAGRRVTIERCTFDRIGLIVFDVEPDYPYEVIDDIRIVDNTVGSYAISPYQTDWFFAWSTANGDSTGPIYIDRNVVTIGASVNTNNPAKKGGLATKIVHSRVAGVYFRNNRTTVPGNSAGAVHSAGAVLWFQNIDGLTVTGNTQPIESGNLHAISGCTSVVSSPNP